MLRPQIVILVALGFLARQDDDLPALIRESFEHPASFGGPVDGGTTEVIENLGQFYR